MKSKSLVTSTILTVLFFIFQTTNAHAETPVFPLSRLPIEREYDLKAATIAYNISRLRGETSCYMFYMRHKNLFISLAIENNVPLEILLAIPAVESNCDNQAVSYAGAVCAFQIYPMSDRPSPSKLKHHVDLCANTAVDILLMFKSETWFETLRRYHGISQSDIDEKYAETVLYVAYNKADFNKVYRKPGSDKYKYE